MLSAGLYEKWRPHIVRYSNFTRAVAGTLISLYCLALGALEAPWFTTSYDSSQLFFIRTFLTAGGIFVFYITVRSVGFALREYFPDVSSLATPPLDPKTLARKHEEYIQDFRQRSGLGSLNYASARSLLIDLVAYGSRARVHETVTFEGNQVRRRVTITPHSAMTFLVLSLPAKSDHHRGYNMPEGSFKTLRFVTTQALLIEAILTVIQGSGNNPVSPSLVGCIRAIVSYEPNHSRFPHLRARESAHEGYSHISQELLARREFGLLSPMDHDLALESLRRLALCRPYVGYCAALSGAIVNGAGETPSATFAYLEHPSELISSGREAHMNWVQRLLRLTPTQVLGLEVFRAARCSHYVLDFASPEGTYVAETGAWEGTRIGESDGQGGWLPSLSRESVYDGFQGWQLTLAGRQARYILVRPSLINGSAAIAHALPNVDRPVLFLRVREEHPNGLDLAFASCLFTSLTVWVCALSLQTIASPKGTSALSTDIAAILVATQALLFAWRTGRRTPDISHALSWKPVIAVNSFISLVAIALYFAITRGHVSGSLESPVVSLFLVRDWQWQFWLLISFCNLAYTATSLVQSYREFRSTRSFAARVPPSFPPCSPDAFNPRLEDI